MTRAGVHHAVAHPALLLRVRECRTEAWPWIKLNPRSDKIQRVLKGPESSRELGESVVNDSGRKRTTSLTEAEFPTWHSGFQTL